MNKLTAEEKQEKKRKQWRNSKRKSRANNPEREKESHERTILNQAARILARNEQALKYFQTQLIAEQAEMLDYTPSK